MYNDGDVGYRSKLGLDSERQEITFKASVAAGLDPRAPPLPDEDGSKEEPPRTTMLHSVTDAAE